ncbi:hypothetical protein V8G54_021219 [Vigna mungo]|uniref:Uncharacterized protein n=1 Tax=Vigna mungo TaxID=3915 RepID=A0AAQ3NFR1_VIGMU
MNKINDSKSAYQQGKPHNNCSSSTDHNSRSSEGNRAEGIGNQTHGISTGSSRPSKHGNSHKNIVQRRRHLNVPPKGMENHPDLQCNDDKNQSNSAIDYTNAVELVGVAGDPPQRPSGGSIELKEKGKKEEEDEVAEGSSGRKKDIVMGCNVKQERNEEKVQSVDATLQGSEDETVTGSLTTVIPGLVFGLEGGDARDGEEPVEAAVEGGEVVGGVVDSDGGDGGPGEEGGCGDGEASEEQALEGNGDGRVFEEEPLELERGPDAEEKGGVGAEEGGDGGDGDGGVEGGEEGGGGGEEEGELGEDKGEPHGKEGGGLEAEGVEDVRDH